MTTVIRVRISIVPVWYRHFYPTLRMEMDGYYEAELTLRLAEISSYDTEGDYGEADKV